MANMWLALSLLPLALCEMAFDEYLQKFGKSYSGSEYADRKELFDRRLQEVQAVNGQPGALWVAGLNEFSDLRAEELRWYMGYNKALREPGNDGTAGDGMLMASAALPELPKRFDWREHQPAVLSPVKKQGRCGSCWAFATASTIESHIALQTGVLISLSPQQLTSCVQNPNKCGGDGGCAGATADLAYDYAIGAGLHEIWEYPYESLVSRHTGTCMNMSTRPVAHITGYERLPRNDAGALMEAVSSIGPLSVNVDASYWYLYTRGIFSSCDMTNPDINHVVQLVGYGEANATPYWLLRNSWGVMWGEAGFMRLRRHEVERCGVDVTPQHGFTCEGGVKNITVCGECGILSDSSYPVGASYGGGFGSGIRRLRDDSGSEPIHI